MECGSGRVSAPAFLWDKRVGGAEQENSHQACLMRLGCVGLLGPGW